MEKKDFKIYGIILVVLAAVVLLGTLTYWNYSTWRIVDWAIIVVCAYIGYRLYKESK